MHTDMNAYAPETLGAHPESQPHPEARPDAASTGDDVEARALDLANQAIAHQASGESGEAARHWREAIALADHGLPGDPLRYWLRSGLAEACFRLGDDAACIAAAAAARAWARQQQAPSTALWLGQALFRSGRVDEALDALGEAQALAGAAFAGALDERHREAILARMATLAA